MKNSEKIGERIDQFRQEKGLSIEQLADKAGCASDYLEWVVQGQTPPPVALLIRLAKALDLESGIFLTFDLSGPDRLEEAAKRADHYSYKTLTPSEGDSHLMAFSVTIPPQTAHEGVGYKHEGEEYVFVVSGQVELSVGSETFTLTTRESRRFNSNEDHHMTNPGDAEAELLVVLYVP